MPNPDPPQESPATQVRTTTHWVVEAKGPWRWLAGVLGLSSLASTFVLAGVLLEEAGYWFLLLHLTLAFGLLMTAVAVRGTVRIPLRRTVTSTAPRDPSN